MRIVRTRRGAVVLEGRSVLSSVLAAPGPLHDLYDVLAGCVVELSPGPRVLLLGFAAGGIVCPLRALGWREPLQGVDLSLEAHRLFREVAGRWAGVVQVARAEAFEWLRGRTGRWDAVVEDLTVRSVFGPIKPPVSVESIPRMVRRRLARRGVAVVNVLPVPGLTWKAILSLLAAPWNSARVVTFRDYENRVLICGARLPTARALSRRLRARLKTIASRQAARFSVRTLVQH